MKYKICTLIGTRPEAIKLAPLIRRMELEKDKIKSSVIVTAQHRDILDDVLRLFSIKADHDLDIMRPHQSLFDVTHRALLGLKPVLEKESPDLVVVQGDTTTVLISGLAAFYLKIPVAHVEAGLRTKDKYQPFPEEVNRRIATVLADLHFAPTKFARNNLLAEGIPQDRIFVTGNTVVDAMLSVLDKDFAAASDFAEMGGLWNKRIILVTAHRRENWGKGLANVCKAIKRIIGLFPDVAVVFSVHPNPNVQKTVHAELGGIERVHLLKPMGYKVFVNLMAKAHIILTDSGGIQEEAPLLGKPVLVLRNVTERQEAIIAGTAKLVGTGMDDILRETKRLLTGTKSYKAMIKQKPPYGTGNASDKIVRIMLKYLKTTRPSRHKPVWSIEPPLT